MLAIEQCATGFAAFSLSQEKVCNTCGETKRLPEFVKKVGGYKPLCKSCQRVKNAEYASKNPGYWTERGQAVKEQSLSFGVDEKYGDTWKELDAALSTCRMTTPLQRAA